MEIIIPLIFRIIKKCYYPIFIYNSFLSLMENESFSILMTSVLSFISKGEK